MHGKSLAVKMTLLMLAVLALAGWTRAPKAAPAVRLVRLTVRVRHTFENAPLRLDDVSLTNRAGNTFSVSRLTYLVSNVSLLTPDGIKFALPNSFACLDVAEQRTAFTLADVPAGHYVGLSFQIGLPPALNHADPARYPAGHPLHPLTNHLHWNWQGGYVFLALEGRYAQGGDRLGGYVYHLATDRCLMNVTLAHAFTLRNDSALDLRFDVARLFDAGSPIAIRPTNGGDSTHSAIGDILAPRLKANVERAFAFERIARADAVKQTPTIFPAVVPETVFKMPATRAAPYTLAIPAGFPQPLLPANNPLTVEGVALGRALFFEKRLSGNGTQSCASCHQPEHAFSDGGKAFSVGIDGKPGARHAMPLFNLAWSAAFTWDGRRTRLRDQALAPIQDVREMRQSLPGAVVNLQSNKNYARLFAAAFGSPGVTVERIGLALEQYLLTLISADSKFDRALRGEVEFTDEEKRGLLLFLTEYDPARGKMGADCFHCHGGSLFADYQFKNNGLDADFKDTGRYGVTGKPSDKGKFKTPSLRNVELTAPYMHDGRFATLEAVVEHYSTSVQRSDTLDPNIAKHPDGGVHLSAEDKAALVAFLKTLTDAKFCASRMRAAAGD